VYVWELPVRVSHWFIVLSVAVLAFTGYYMHNPFIIVRSGSAYLMGTMRFIHLLAASVFISAFLLRIYWFFVGNEWSNWRAFVPIHRQQWQGMGNMVAYYSFLRRDLAHHVGHNALAAVTYMLMFTLMLVEILTGLALYSYTVSSKVLSFFIGWLPRWIDISYLRLIHFCIMFAFFIFVIHHVYSAVLVSWEERNGLVESIFTGYKFVPEAELQESESAKR
jgi:Ni/Fe-hydrogenase 1 B-type cytochrome subunit